MTDPKCGKANIKKKTPVVNYKRYEENKKFPSRFQRNIDVEIEVSEYNTKAGKMKL